VSSIGSIKAAIIKQSIPIVDTTMSRDHEAVLVTTAAATFSLSHDWISEVSRAVASNALLSGLTPPAVTGRSRCRWRRFAAYGSSLT
jgi:hypothetical protein